MQWGSEWSVTTEGVTALKKRKKKVQNSGDSGHYDFWPVAICTNFISFLYHANIMPTFSNAHTHTFVFVKIGDIPWA